MPSAARDEPLPTGEALARLIGPETVRRFSDELSSLGYEGGPVAVAVSGGPDSTALLLLAAAAAGGMIEAATVDHGLRPGSAAEAAQVSRLCGRLGVRHATLSVTIPKMRGGLQAGARMARYSALQEWCKTRWLLVAHHRDDVAETLLMRLARGSGVHGLARMRQRWRYEPDDITVLRPLLAWSKADLLGICARAGIETIRDPSNMDERFDRTAARSVLAKAPWLDPKRLYRSATNLAEAEIALEWLAERCWGERAVVHGGEGEIEIDAVGLPHETKRRLVERVMRRFAGHDPDRQVETLIAMLERGEYAMLGDVQAIPGRVWRFRRAPPRRPG
ncbi:tRNA lysidine(34) synthetase TilS [Sphingomonas sp.]|uniref:tRNA lysidine(34) synthetase TilS n=1 Tax=Sphingomonas sp. TaxID=28214 RepID=UPI003B00EDB9